MEKSEPRQRKISAKENLYLSWQPSNKTWRQFWEDIQGKDPFWMTTTQYGGDWLNKKMNEPI
jgi:hypothetical protein